MIEQLNELVGKDFNYKGKNLTVFNWKKVGSLYVVNTTIQVYNFLESEVDMFISELSEIKEIVIKAFNAEPQHNEMNITISQTLMEALNKVKHNKEYIQQANAICNIVSQMINIQKIEIQLLKK